MGEATKPTALEFFAGGGLARLGLAGQFDVVWANDIDAVKASAWQANFGEAGFVQSDVHDVRASDIPSANLAWASFPCQDLSLAGGRAGLGAARSGTFFAFANLIQGLAVQGRAPSSLVIENVTGLLNSRGGVDFATLMRTLVDLGYNAGALEIDARHFVPQSRPRVFVVASRKGVIAPQHLLADQASNAPFHSAALVRAHDALPDDLRRAHVWWSLPIPPKGSLSVADLIDHTDQNWWSAQNCAALIDSFSPRHCAKLLEVQKSGELHVGTVYRRTRRIDGVARPVAEVRFDGVAGCLRTPSGGSSRQFLIFVEGKKINVRALNAREAMRLMGVADSYVLPNNERRGLKIAGDGVCVPVVAWLTAHLLIPLHRASLTV
jgi:DNA (cytosine-5)-methyltransferase 1